MFIWDFVMGDVMDQIINWFYGHLVGFLADFFAQMGNMGVELFDMTWVQSIVLFFSYLAWALYGIGLVVSCFETGIEYQYGRGSVKDAALNAIKGFMAVSLFTTAPIELYKLSVNLQASLATGLTGHGSGIGDLANSIIGELGKVSDVSMIGSAGVFGGLSTITSPIMGLFIVILMGYAVIKVFFANLKRGGILLIQIAVGSLYMFSVQGLHRWLHSMDEANHRTVFDYFPTGDHLDCWTYGRERSRLAWPWADAFSRRSAKDCRCIWSRHFDQSKCNECGLYRSGSGEHDKNDSTGNTKIEER